MGQSRIFSLDVLRGVAILLVLFTHKDSVRPLELIGWTGVDLFFVLSGFLVSGLLFREYKLSANVDFKRFFIRRGFKIYPLYYLFLFVSVVSIWLLEHRFELGGLLAESLFVSNFRWGLGYGTYAQAGLTWSLAIEEQFYISLGLGLVLLARYRKMQWVPWIALGLLVVVLGLRAWLQPNAQRLVFASFFTRCDGLSFGVLLSYAVHFHGEAVALFCRRWQWALAAGMVLALSSAYMLIYQAGGSPVATYALQVWGHSLLWLGYGTALLLMLHSSSVERAAGWPVIGPLLRGLSFVGQYSYSLYLWHAVVLSLVFHHLWPHLGLSWHYGLEFLLFVALSFATAYGMGRLVEQPSLQLRDRLFPSRAA